MYFVIIYFRHFIQFPTIWDVFLLHSKIWSMWNCLKEIKNLVYLLPSENTYSVAIQEPLLSHHCLRYASNLFSLYTNCSIVSLSPVGRYDTHWIQSWNQKIYLYIFCFSCDGGIETSIKYGLTVTDYKCCHWHIQHCCCTANIIMPCLGISG